MRTHTHAQSLLAIPEQEAILALYLLSPSDSASPPQPSRPGRVIYSTLGTGEDIDLTALPSSSCLGSTEVGRGRAGGLRGRAGGQEAEPRVERQSWGSWSEPGGVVGGVAECRSSDMVWVPQSLFGTFGREVTWERGMG